MNDIKLYTDGACSGNPGPGGWAAIIINGDYIHKISGKVKVVKTVYDTLSERYTSMELGSVSTNFARTVSENIATSAKQTSSALELAVETATKKITGNIGGYVVFKLNANGNPEELLIMYTNDISTATKVWRWNKEGLGHSSTGYNGKYGLAMTSDGEKDCELSGRGRNCG